MTITDYTIDCGYAVVLISHISVAQTTEAIRQRDGVKGNKVVFRNLNQIRLSMKSGVTVMLPFYELEENKRHLAHISFLMESNAKKLAQAP